MLTAYTAKGKLSSERSSVAITAFFTEHFGNFVSKHTLWSVLSEPEVQKITPRILNQTRTRLLSIYRNELSVMEDMRAQDKNLFH